MDIIDLIRVSMKEVADRNEEPVKSKQDFLDLVEKGIDLVKKKINYLD